MALNCNKEIPGVTDYEAIGVPAGQCYHCHTGRCPVGITTQDPELRKRLDVDEAAQRVFNFLHTLTLEVQMLARACGKTSVHSLEPEDLAALTVEASAMAKVPLAGTDYIPGSARAGAGRDPTLLDQYLENPVDYLPSTAATGRRNIRDPRRRGSRAREGHLDRRRVPVGTSLPVPGGHLAGRGHRPRGGDPGQGPELARDVELLEEEGTPAVFDRYSNSFLRIYFPIPEGRENEIARKVLIAHLTSGNSYGIRLKPRGGARPVGHRVPDRRRGLEAVGARGLGAAGALVPPMSARHPLVIGAGSMASRPPGISPRPARRCSWSTSEIAAGPPSPAG